MWIVPVSSTSPLQPGGTSTVDSGSSTTAGPSSFVPGAGIPREHLELDLLAVERRLAPVALEVVRRRSPPASSTSTPAAVAVTRIVTSSSSCSASR